MTVSWRNKEVGRSPKAFDQRKRVNKKYGHWRPFSSDYPSRQDNNYYYYNQENYQFLQDNNLVNNDELCSNKNYIQPCFEYVNDLTENFCEPSNLTNQFLPGNNLENAKSYVDPYESENVYKKISDLKENFDAQASFLVNLGESMDMIYRTVAELKEQVLELRQFKSSFNIQKLKTPTLDLAVIQEEKENISQLMCHAKALDTAADYQYVRHMVTNIPEYSGNPDKLRDFIIQIEHSRKILTIRKTNKLIEQEYIHLISRKLTNKASNAIFGMTFETIEEFIHFLKGRFTPERDYSYYTKRLRELIWEPGEPLGEFYNKIRILLIEIQESALDVLPPIIGINKSHAVDAIMQFVRKTAINVFIKNLPPPVAFIVDGKTPTTLEEAYKEALRIKSRVMSKILKISK